MTPKSRLIQGCKEVDPPNVHLIRVHAICYHVQLQQNMSYEATSSSLQAMVHLPIKPSIDQSVHVQLQKN